ncbi:hypothetical protein [Paractinoplanes toevensis]|uniref:hypothetical protein n=1 Tax=Paractinoplanes toevensis TaxID=571911 RepID=UPI001BB2F21C|nr:hypothetical protein [Actinoplanes toevensis]
MAGCSHDKPEKSDIAAGPIAQPGVSESAAGPLSFPAGATPTTATAPATAAATPTLGATAGATAAPATTRPRVTADPSRPTALPRPNVGSLQNAWITATVTRGGTGPCYTLTSTDGATYAVYSTQGIKLANGDKVRARITPGTTPVNCGTGQPARLERLQLAG